ncbi:hypothetical protein C8R43DRAFT_982094 [Mycena crocata]|nr:hypothetical protein C8R43DRAFT_982094 [Mycena crocata]
MCCLPIFSISPRFAALLLSSVLPPPDATQSTSSLYFITYILKSSVNFFFAACETPPSPGFCITNLRPSIRLYPLCV